MRQILCVLTLVLLAASGIAQVADGDQHWLKRAEGHNGGRARPAHIDAAIAAYQRAITQNPNDLEPRWKLLRAYRFKGAYTASNAEEKKLIYSAAKKAGSDALSILNRQLAAKSVLPAKANERQVADVARTIAGAGETFLWDAINWGEWALAYGKLAAAKQGAGDRIRRQATIAMLIDPRLEGGSPSRVLGRLHDQTPRVPFITGWASSKEAVRLLGDSLKIDPSNKIGIVFLAEAMVSNDPKTRPQAIQMLRTAANAPNDPEYVVEQTAAQEDARVLLRKWGG